MSGFSRSFRLISKQDFQFVFAKPYKVSHRYLLALYRPNQCSHPRLGIIISKQHVKRAVDRNLLRRIIRESFRYHRDMLKELDIIVLVRSKWSPLDSKTLRNDIDNLWLLLINSFKPD